MFAASKTASVSGGYQISRSLRFNSADSAYLNRTPASAGNRKTWTWSGWVKRGALGTNNMFWSAYGGAGDSLNTAFYFNTSDALVMSGATTDWRITTQVFRDPSAWYHIVLAIDTTQATAGDRIKIYVNGQQITAFSTTNNPTQNLDLAFNNTISHYISGSPAAGGYYYNGYMTEIYNVDGSQLTPSSFGETNAQTGVWQPKAYSGSYGTNGFYLNFSDNSNTTAATLGKDYSGNGNNWTPNNFSVTAGAGNDSLVDSPTSYGTDTGVGGQVRGNYSTLNPLNTATTLANGNLDYSSPSTAPAPAYSSIGMTSGKWYFESTITTTNTLVGVWGNGNSGMPTSGYPTYYWDIGASSATSLTLEKTSGSASGTLGSLAANDVYGVALDVDNTTIYFYKNNSLVQTVTGMSFVGPLFFVVGSWANSSTASSSVNFGQRPFAYTAPSGYKALCTQNLPTPTIGATTATQAGKYFNPVLYTGTGATLAVTGAGFQPDLVWIKQRNASRNHNLYDAVRGALKVLQANVTDAEVNYAGSLTSFDSDGFSLGTASDVNVSSATYVAWNWKANGSGSTNTSGSITSTVSANTTSGFSVVTFTGVTGGGTVGHGLGVAPSMIIVKSRNNVVGWVTYHASLGADKYLLLNTTDSVFTNTSTWKNTSPTSTVFSVGDNAFPNTWTEVAYCFAEVAGYSKFGSFVGNGSADGPFVYCGFRPRYVMTKRSDAAGENWHILDTVRNTYNVEDKLLYPNLSNAEGTFSTLDINSNGFKIRNSDVAFNASGGTYIFAAFAEAPLKYALAR